MTAPTARRSELLDPDDLLDLEKHLTLKSAGEDEDRMLGVIALLRAFVEFNRRPALPAPSKKDYRGTRLEKWLPDAVRGKLTDYPGALTLSRLKYRSFQNLLTDFRKTIGTFEKGGLAPRLVRRQGFHELRWSEFGAASAATRLGTSGLAERSPAEEEYETAKPLVGERTLGSLLAARRHLLAALALDPGHGNALGMLSICEGLLVDFGYVNPEGLKVRLDEMKSLLGPPEKTTWHMYATALGVYEMQQTRDFSAALHHFRRAQTICERHGLSCVSWQHWLSKLFSIHGDHEAAITLLNRACAQLCESFAPAFLQTKRANAYYLAGDFSTAEQLLLRLIEGHGAISKTFVTYARICGRRGLQLAATDRNESIWWFEKGARALDRAVEAGEVYIPRPRRGAAPSLAPTVEESVYVLTERVLLYSAAAKVVDDYASRAEAAARTVFDRANQHGVHVPLYFQTLIHHALGDRDATIRNLWSAVERGCTRVIGCKVDPRLRDLRGDPDYEDICAAVFERPLK